ncbi:hypothetical protein T11_15535 [Trichinella zimbabwensis]|uniref:Uncharacterized protein n=1 Tax=Trichinella zimbabwensis TaxID=268475 RepID=A0A0V1H9P1_9BILA|nr:hypothetical protein T11_15535 [Trichinella zimbabwensis]
MDACGCDLFCLILRPHENPLTNTEMATRIWGTGSHPVTILVHLIFSIFMDALFVMMSDDYLLLDNISSFQVSPIHE